MKKGFTLIELLAVIIILGIISLIVVPQVLSIISNSKKSTEKINVDLYLKSLQEEISSMEAENELEIESCEIYDGIAYCGDIEINSMKNKISGTVNFKNGEISYSYLESDGVKYLNGYTDKKCFEYTVINNSKNVRIKKYTPYYDECSLDVIIPPIIDDMNVTIIANNAFRNWDLTSVIIPDTITTIGSNAFAYNSLTSIIIPNGVTDIGANAFQENQIEDLIIPDSVINIGDNAFNRNLIKNLIIGKRVSTIGFSAFQENLLKDIKIPDSVTSIGANAFRYNNLESVTLGESNSAISYVGTYAFAQGSYMQSNITYGPNEIKSLDIYAPEGSIDLSSPGFNSYSDLVVTWH